MFMPVTAAELNAASPTASYTGGRCFEDISFAFAKTSDTTFDITVTTGEPKSKTCSDSILFANTEI